MSTPRQPLPQQPGDDAERAREAVTVRRVEFPALADAARDAPPLPTSVLSNVEVPVAAVLGSARLTVRDIITMRPGTLIQLDRMAGESVDLRINNVTVAGGEVIVIDDRYAVRINAIGRRGERRPPVDDVIDETPVNNEQSGEGTQDDAAEG
ncbi:MAG TPA: FliM/FliN family flagellar motor switch protein [Thermomicrobiales bacterium]|nr:FliM/FliN family flagellar motor switch protein [Thermomicrobiales bacterium]